MQKPQEVLDSYYLEARCQLLEIAALLDRFDRSCESDVDRPDDGRIDLMYESLTLLSQREGTANRSERLLNLFSDPE
ncbi:MAG: hypothetical protein ACF8AM_24210 [Rhodopirellula sp. JB055]|uniref:hypothetical protein n=1 Tax=Rhodopirellula sp. JB055 TaxID=3342846 RepID=UPI00370CE7DB